MDCDLKIPARKCVENTSTDKILNVKEKSSQLKFSKSKEDERVAGDYKTSHGKQHFVSAVPMMAGRGCKNTPVSHKTAILDRGELRNFESSTSSKNQTCNEKSKGCNSSRENATTSYNDPCKRSLVSSDTANVREESMHNRPEANTANNTDPEKYLDTNNRSAIPTEDAGRVKITKLSKSGEINSGTTSVDSRQICESQKVAHFVQSEAGHAGKMKTQGAEVPQGKSEKKSEKKSKKKGDSSRARDSEVRQMARRVAGSMETLIDELHHVVGDIQQLVLQIDVVTDSLDRKQGHRRQPSAGGSSTASIQGSVSDNSLATSHRAAASTSAYQPTRPVSYTSNPALADHNSSVRITNPVFQETSPASPTDSACQSVKSVVDQFSAFLESSRSRGQRRERQKQSKSSHRFSYPQYGMKLPGEQATSANASPCKYCKARSKARGCSATVNEIPDQDAVDRHRDTKHQKHQEQHDKQKSSNSSSDGIICKDCHAGSNIVPNVFSAYKQGYSRDNRAKCEKHQANRGIDHIRSVCLTETSVTGVIKQQADASPSNCTEKPESKNLKDKLDCDTLPELRSWREKTEHKHCGSAESLTPQMDWSYLALSEHDPIPTLRLVSLKVPFTDGQISQPGQALNEGANPEMGEAQHVEKNSSTASGQIRDTYSFTQAASVAKSPDISSCPKPSVVAHIHRPPGSLIVSQKPPPAPPARTDRSKLALPGLKIKHQLPFSGAVDHRMYQQYTLEKYRRSDYVGNSATKVPERGPTRDRRRESDDEVFYPERRVSTSSSIGLSDASSADFSYDDEFADFSVDHENLRNNNSDYQHVTRDELQTWEMSDLERSVYDNVNSLGTCSSENSSGTVIYHPSPDVASTDLAKQPYVFNTDNSPLEHSNTQNGGARSDNGATCISTVNAEGRCNNKKIGKVDANIDSLEASAIKGTQNSMAVSRQGSGMGDRGPSEYRHGSTGGAVPRVTQGVGGAMLGWDARCKALPGWLDSTGDLSSIGACDSDVDDLSSPFLPQQHFHPRTSSAADPSPTAGSAARAFPLHFRYPRTSSAHADPIDHPRGSHNKITDSVGQADKIETSEAISPTAAHHPQTAGTSKAAGLYVKTSSATGALENRVDNNVRLNLAASSRQHKSIANHEPLEEEPSSSRITHMLANRTHFPKTASQNERLSHNSQLSHPTASTAALDATPQYLQQEDRCGVTDEMHNVKAKSPQATTPRKSQNYASEQASAQQNIESDSSSSGGNTGSGSQSDEAYGDAGCTNVFPTSPVSQSSLSDTAPSEGFEVRTRMETSPESDVSTPYAGQYENAMETKLERLSSEADFSDFSDADADAGSDVLAQSLTSLESSGIKFDRDVSTWKSYTMTHIDSDDAVSDPASDVFNENVMSSSVTANPGFDDVKLDFDDISFPSVAF
jgi:hypothetical protein